MTAARVAPGFLFAQVDHIFRLGILLGDRHVHFHVHGADVQSRRRVGVFLWAVILQIDGRSVLKPGRLVLAHVPEVLMRVDDFRGRFGGVSALAESNCEAASGNCAEEFAPTTFWKWRRGAALRLPLPCNQGRGLG